MNDERKFHFDLPSDIWRSVILFGLPSTLSSINRCCKYLNSIANPQSRQMRKYWENQTKLLVQHDGNLNIIGIPDNFIPSDNNWFKFYVEWRRVTKSITANLKNDTKFPQFRDAGRIPIEYQRFIDCCVECDSTMIFSVLMTNDIISLLKKLGDKTLKNEMVRDLLAIWCFKQSIERNHNTFNIIDDILKLKDVKLKDTLLIGTMIRCINLNCMYHELLGRNFDGGPDISRTDIHVYKCFSIEKRKNILETLIDIIKRLIGHPSMTRDILDTYVDHYSYRNRRKVLEFALTLDNQVKHFDHQINITSLLLKKGVDVISPLEIDERTTAALQITRLLRTENLKLFKMIYNANNEILFDKDVYNGMTTLMNSVDKGYFNIVKFIVNQLKTMKCKIESKRRKGTLENIDCFMWDKIDKFINAERSKDGYTAYFIACEKGRWDIIQCIISQLKINVRDSYLKEYSCIGYAFRGSEVAKAAGHEKVSRGLYDMENQEYKPNTRQQYHTYTSHHRFFTN